MRPEALDPETDTGGDMSEDDMKILRLLLRFCRGCMGPLWKERSAALERAILELETRS
jgi:hypothetical protein